MQRWKTLAGMTIGGALLAGTIWGFIDGTYTINGVGLFRRQGWPLDVPWLFVGIGAVGGFLSGLKRSSAEQGLVDGLAALCKEQGLSYTAVASCVDFPLLPLLRNWQEGRHLLSGEWGGVPVQMLDVTTQSGQFSISNDGGSLERNGGRCQTLALVNADGLPAFDLRPRKRGNRILKLPASPEVTFDPSAVADPADAAEVRRFVERFHLSLIEDVEGAEQVVRRVFSPRVMRALDQYDGYSAQVADGTLAVWRGESSLHVRDRPALLDIALEWRAALGEGAATLEQTERDAEPVVAAALGLDGRRHFVRKARIDGAIKGFFLAGFAGWMVGVLFMIVLLSTLPWSFHRKGSLLFIATPFACAFLGGALGAFVASRRGARAAMVPKRNPNPGSVPGPNYASGSVSSPRSRWRGDQLFIQPSRSEVSTVLTFFVVFAGLGWFFFILSTAELLGWKPVVNMEGSRVAGLALGGLFALIGHALTYNIVAINLDAASRTWRSVRGFWPLRIVKSGSLDEVSRVAVARELREDENSTTEVVVARLEWRDSQRKPLKLIELPIASATPTNLMTGVANDARPSVRTWAREVADRLGLPLVDRLR